MRDQDEVRARDAGVDGGRVGDEVVVGPEHAARVAGQLGRVEQTEPGSVPQAGEIGIHQDHPLAVVISQLRRRDA